MVTLMANKLTIADAAKRLDSKGNIAPIAELLHQQNGIIADIPWREGDTIGGHMSVKRTSLPTIYTRNANEGVLSSKSGTAQVLEAPEILEGWCVIDEIVAKYGGDVAGKRTSEAVSFAEAMNQAVADRLIYGNGGTTPGQLDGLAKRYNSLSGTLGSQVINGGGSGSDNLSIWIIDWDEANVYGWYPKGMPGGLHIEDWGRQVEFDSNGKQKVVYKEQWQWSIGLAVDNPYCVVRICNVDVSDLVANTSPADLFELMTLGTHKLKRIGPRASIYMNRTARMWLDVQARASVQLGGQLSYEVVDGRRIEVFRGIPITILDRLTEAEAAVA